MIIKTPQQEAIIEHMKDSSASSLGVDAKAGSGKTSTGIMICNELEGSAFFGAFNKGIAVELQTRLRGIENSMIEAGTWHSLGFRGWRRVYPKVAVDGDKLWKIIDGLGSVKTTCGGAIRELVSIAKQSLFEGHEEADEWQDIIDYHGIETQNRTQQVIEAAKKVFMESMDQCKTVIDFDDMLFAPLHFGCELPKYDTVLIDEAQDTNYTRRELAVRCMEEGGRLVYLGDVNQAIYGFSGADAEAMNLIREKVDAELLPLTVSWRCAKEIIKRAQAWVPTIEHAPAAKQGEILYTTEGEVLKQLIEGGQGVAIPRSGDAVLCRNTKPLVQMAYHCIRNRVGVTIEGRDIGKRLTKLVEKFKEPGLSKLRERVYAYSIEEQARLIQKNKPGIAALVADMCDTIDFLVEGLMLEGKKDTRDLTDLLNRMFSDSNGGNRSTILLSTIHKAKGREWEKVFILGEDRYQPSKYAKQPWMLQQEMNLMYVATTRAKDTLVHIEVTG